MDQSLLAKVGDALASVQCDPDMRYIIVVIDGNNAAKVGHDPRISRELVQRILSRIAKDMVVEN